MTEVLKLSLKVCILFLSLTSCTWVSSITVKNRNASTAALSLTAQYNKITVANQVDFYPAGGQQPYSYSVLMGQGSMDPSTGRYTPHASDTNVLVKVTDAQGQVAEKSIEVLPSINLSGSTVQNIGFKGSQNYLNTVLLGGIPPFQYSIVSGPGQIDQSSGLFTAPGSSLPTVIRIRDSLNNEVMVNVTNGSIFTNGEIHAFEKNGNDLFIGGKFTRINPSHTPGTALFNASNGRLADSDCNSKYKMESPFVTAMAATSTHLYFAGDITSYGQIAVQNLIRISRSDCTLDQNFTQALGFNNWVQDMVIVGSSLFVVGGFTTYRGQPAAYFAKLDLESGNLDPLFMANHSMTGSSLSDIKYHDGHFYILGSISVYRGTTVQNLIKINADTGVLDTTFTQTTALLSNAESLMIANNSLYVCSTLDFYRGVASGNLIKLNLITGNRDVGFNVDFSIGGGSYCKMDTDGASLYIGGEIYSINGTATQGLAKVNINTGVVDTTFTQASGLLGNEGVNFIFYHDNYLYVSGWEAADYYRGDAVSNFFRVNANDGSLDKVFSNVAATEGVVFSSLILGNGQLMVGGFFNFYGGSPALNLAKYNLATKEFDTTFSDPGGFNGEVNTMKIDGTSLYVGGAFTKYQETPANYMAKVSVSTGSLDTTFTQGTGFNQVVWSLLITGGSLYAGGKFTTYRGATALYMSKHDLTSGNLDTTFTQATGFTTGAFYIVRSLATDGVGLFATGSFVSYRGTGISAIGKFNLTNGNLDNAFSLGGGISGTIFVPAYYALYFNNSLYVMGTISGYRGTTVAGLIKVDPINGNLDTTFTQTTGIGHVNANYNQCRSCLIGDGGALYVGGYINSYRGTSVGSMIRIDANTGVLDSTFNTSSAFNLSAMTFYDLGTQIISGGSFNSYRGKTSFYFGIVDKTTGEIE